MTSQHVHISLNNSTVIIRPEIYLILSILCICLYFQNEIFKLFLITRSNNIYCKKLNYNIYDDSNYIINPNEYNDCLLKIYCVFNDVSTAETNNLNLFNFLGDKPILLNLDLNMDL